MLMIIDNHEKLTEEFKNLKEEYEGLRLIRELWGFFGKISHLRKRNIPFEIDVIFQIMVVAYIKISDQHQTFLACREIMELANTQEIDDSKSGELVLLSQMAYCSCIAKQTGSHKSIDEAFANIRRLAQRWGNESWTQKIDHLEVKAHNKLGPCPANVNRAENQLAQRKMREFHSEAMFEDGDGDIANCCVACYVEDYATALAINGEVERAKKAIDRDIEQHDQQGQILHCKGWLHFNLGEFEETIATCDRLFEVNEDYGWYFMRGMAYWFQGKEGEAIDDFLRSYNGSSKEMGENKWLLALGVHHDPPYDTYSNPMNKKLDKCLNGKLSYEKLLRFADKRSDAGYYKAIINCLWGVRAEMADDIEAAVRYYRLAAEFHCHYHRSVCWANASLRKLTGSTTLSWAR